MWTTFNVRWDFATPLCASVPADPEYIKRWLESRQPTKRPDNARPLEDIAKEVANTTTQQEDQPPQLLQFQRHEDQYCVRAATVRAHLKECASTLSSMVVGRVEGERSFAVRAKNAIYWPMKDYWIPILDQKTDKPITRKPDTIERPVHPVTPRGTISALKVFECFEDAAIEFKLMVLTQPSGKLVIDEEDLGYIMMYGGTHGYAGERSYDGGRYSYTITRVSPVKASSNGSESRPASESRRRVARAQRGHSGPQGARSKP